MKLQRNCCRNMNHSRRFESIQWKCWAIFGNRGQLMMNYGRLLIDNLRLNNWEQHSRRVSNDTDRSTDIFVMSSDGLFGGSELTGYQWRTSSLFGEDDPNDTSKWTHWHSFDRDDSIDEWTRLSAATRPVYEFVWLLTSVFGIFQSSARAGLSESVCSCIQSGIVLFSDCKSRWREHLAALRWTCKQLGTLRMWKLIPEWHEARTSRFSSLPVALLILILHYYFLLSLFMQGPVTAGVFRRKVHCVVSSIAVYFSQ